MQNNETNANMPAHVGIIMDGNGRWATKRGMPRTFGHNAGKERLRDIVEASSDLGIQTLTVYAFSSENWKRPAEEVHFLGNLFRNYFAKESREMHKKNVRINMIGDPEPFAPELREIMRDAMELTKNNTGLQVNFALNYGGQNEIVRAARLLAQDVLDGKQTVDGIDHPAFEQKLYTADMPQLDVIIRTGGDKRLSNFLMYQAAYAELIFVDDYWPDFTRQRYEEVLQEFSRRNRRFGGL